MHSPCGEEIYGTPSFADDQHSFGLEVFPEELAATKPELPGFSDTASVHGSTAASIGRSVTNHLSPPRFFTSSTDQAQSRDGLPDSTPPEGRISAQDPFPSPRHRSVLRQRPETHRDPRRRRASGGHPLVWCRERDRELEYAVLQFEWERGEAERLWVGADG